MTFTVAQLVTWLIIGALAGSAAGALFTRRRRGFGPLGNIAVGLIGAVVGGLLFRALNLQLGLPAISFDDVVAAFVGALILLLLLSLLRR